MLDSAQFVGGVDALTLAVDIWSFTSMKLGDTLHKRRVRLVAQERYTGIELWRRLCVEYEGCDLLAQMAGRRKLQSFPQCSSLGNLTVALENLRDQVRRYSQDLPEQPLKVMLMEILPKDMEAEVLKRNDLFYAPASSIIDWAIPATVLVPQRVPRQPAHFPGNDLRCQACTIDQTTRRANTTRQTKPLRCSHCGYRRHAASAPTSTRGLEQAMFPLRPA